MGTLTYYFVFVATLAVLCFSGKQVGKHESGKKTQPTGTYNRTTGPKTYSCHPDFTPQGEGVNMTCIKKTWSPLIAYCEAGILQHDGCIHSIPPAYTCPPGYYNNGNGGLKDKKKHQQTTDTCIKIDRAPIDIFCNNQWELQGDNCVSYQISPIMHICPLDQQHKNKHGNDHGYDQACTDYENIPYILSCPKGLTQRGDSCIGIEQRPCPVYTEYYKKEKDHGGKKHRDLGEKHGDDYGYQQHMPIPTKDYGPKLCPTEFVQPAIRTCPPNSFESVTHNNKYKDKKKHDYQEITCLKSINIPLEPYCPLPNGIMDIETNTCKSHMVEPAMTRCPIGYHNCNNTQKKQKYKHDYNDLECCSIGYSGLIPGCPIGFELYHNECIQHLEPLYKCGPNTVIEDDQCLGMIIKPPKIHYQINITTKGSLGPYLSQSNKHKKSH